MKKTLIAGMLILGMTQLSAASDLFADPNYKSKCAMCHGANGEGKAAMKTTPLKAAAAKTDAELTEIMNKGKGKMPGYAGKLTPDQIKAMVAAMKALK